MWASVIRRDGDRTALRFELGLDAELERRLAGFVAGLEAGAPGPS